MSYDSVKSYGDVLWWVWALLLGLRPKDALLGFRKAYLGNEESSEVGEVREERRN